MEDKKQDVNSLEELLKVVNAYSGWFSNLADELSKVLADIQTSKKKEEDTWEMKCPYDYSDKVHILDSEGYAYGYSWSCRGWDFNTFNQGNVFQTKEAAELESKRRNLLTRFRAFRDECNGDWKIDLKRSDNKFYISYSDNMLGLCVYSFGSIEGFNLFGCFKNKEDAERAIKLFGAEIQELFVECD